FFSLFKASFIFFKENMYFLPLFSFFSFVHLIYSIIFSLSLSLSLSLLCSNLTMVPQNFSKFLLPSYIVKYQ
ncbi:MAG: hypothetical protein N7Q72_02035, partial [Spiroplasma sp. Tabriz.8]|nr:hypothetical protein [Spiroplasma sp. Tabriz.8]